MPTQHVTLIMSFFELGLLLLLLISSKKVKQYGAGVALPLVIGGLLIDPLIIYLEGHKIHSNYITFEIMSLILGIRFFAALKKYRLELIVVLILLYLIINVIARIYQARGWYNIHFWNFYYIFSAGVCYILFFRILRLKTLYRKAYIIVSTLLFICFSIEFLLNDDPTRYINTITVIVYNLQNIFLSGIIIARHVVSPSDAKLQYQPYFWIFAGFIFDGLVNSVGDALHAYFVKNDGAVYDFLFLYAASDYSRNFLDLCFFISILLCVRGVYQERISIIRFQERP